jgi:Na+/H+ antiporter NhaD/arsenite permease-like protein
MPSHATIAVAVFALTYVVIAAGEFPYLRIDRTGAALAGAVAMVVFGVLDEQQAAHSVDYHTLALLLGMMIVVANLRLSGAFARFARALLERAKSGFGMLAVTIVVSGAYSPSDRRGRDGRGRSRPSAARARHREQHRQRRDDNR